MKWHGDFLSCNLLLLVSWFLFQITGCSSAIGLSCTPPCECFPHPNVADSHHSRDHPTSLPIQNVTCVNAIWTFVPNIFDPRIRHLNITRTDITDLRKDLVNYPSLQTLILSHNRISKLEFKNLQDLTQLTVLDLSHNQLVLLASDVFKLNTNLLSLNLSNNYLSHISPEVFASLPFLTDLDLSNNHLVDIDFMQPNASGLSTLSQPRNLSLLNLAGNLFCENSTGWINAAKNGTFPSLIWSTITVLNLSRNLLNMDVSTILSVFPGVQRLILSACEITRLNVSVLEGFPNVKSVDLSNNKIRQVEAQNEESLLKVLQRSDDFALNLVGNPVVCDCLLVRLEKKMGRPKLREALRGVACMEGSSQKLEELRAQCLPVDRSYLFPVLVAMLVVCLLICMSAILFVAYKRYRKRLRAAPASKTSTLNEKAWSSSALQALAGQDDGRPVYKPLETLPENSLLEDSISVSQSLEVDGAVDSENESDTELEENVYATIEDLYVNSIHMGDERAFSVMTMNRTGKEPVTEL